MRTRKMEWFERFKTGKRAINYIKAKKSGSEQTIKMISLSVWDFCEFKGIYNPDKIFEEYVNLVKKDEDEGLEQIDLELDTFFNWLVEEKGNKRSSAAVKHAYVKSWLKYNSRKFKGRFGSPKYISKKIPPISKEDLKTVLEYMDIRERALTLFLKDSGMSISDALRLNYGDIKREFESGKKFIHIHAIRKKENVEYDTFIGPNAIEALKVYLQERKNRGEVINDDSPLFVTKWRPFNRLDANTVFMMFANVSKLSGIKISAHRLRKFFDTYMSMRIRHPVILKYWMGHKLASDVEARYIIPPIEEQRRLYAEAYSQIDLSPKPSELEILIAETKARLQTLDPNQRKLFIESLKFRRPDLINHPEIKKILKKLSAEGGLAPQPKYKEISEEELLAHLNNGWKIVHTLKNGRIIVKR